MTPIVGASVAENTTRHCTEPGCRKCAARGRWMRRKGWRSRKDPARRKSGRK